MLCPKHNIGLTSHELVHNRAHRNAHTITNKCAHKRLKKKSVMEQHPYSTLTMHKELKTSYRLHAETNLLN